MNYIIIDSGVSIGGIETLLIEICNYIVSKGDNVTFISKQKDTIYRKKVLESNKISHISLDINYDIEYLSSKKIQQIKNKFYKEFKLNKLEEYYVICPGFCHIQIGILLFSDKNNVRLMHIWGHPEDWKNSINIISRPKMTSKIIVNDKYKYQKKLLERLDKDDANFYGAKVVQVFNSWYYNVCLKDKRIEKFPIKHIEYKYDYFYEKNKNTLNVVWCGRFDYWKNEAIKHIYDTLILLSKKYLDINFNFDIIGYGTKKFNDDIFNHINNESIKVNFIGKVDNEELSDFLKRYDLGIGMGLSVKKMAQVGLPAIVIDSAPKSRLDLLKCDWLFNTTDGDAGDGYYFEITGKKIDGRKRLIDLLEEILNDRELINIYSKKSYEYVRENYDESIQTEKIIKLVKDSKFINSNYEIYIRNCLEKYTYLGVKKVKDNIKKMIMR